MQRTCKPISTAVVLLALALAGCGSSETSGNASSLQKLRPTTSVAVVRFSSPAVRGGRLPATYTCDGKNVSPPLSWGSVPSNLHELALFAIGVRQSSSGQVLRTVEWAMAGVAPVLRRLAAGEIPRGAFLEQSSDGKRQYSICPTKGQSERYEFALYALPELIRAGPQITGAALLRNLTGRIPQGRAPAEGTFTATYTRQ